MNRYNVVLVTHYPNAYTGNKGCKEFMLFDYHDMNFATHQNSTLSHAKGDIVAIGYNAVKGDIEKASRVLLEHTKVDKQ